MVNQVKIKFTQLIVIVLLLLKADALSAQVLSESRTNSVYTYIYKLESSELKELLTNYYFYIPEDFLKHKVDSFCNDSGDYYTPKLPIGHYILVKAEGSQLKTSLVSTNTFDVKLLDNKRDLNLFIHKKESTESIITAKVTINKKNIPFDPKTNTYRLPKSNRNGLLVVEIEGETAFYKLDREQNNFQLKRIGKTIIYSFPLRYVYFPISRLYYGLRYGEFSFRHNYSSKSRGFIAFNKPKYLPGDTLQWKAFITNKKGTPIKKTLVVTLEKNYPEQIISSEIVIPKSNGAYNGELILGDSLKIDTRYIFKISNPKSKKELLTNDFYLEDYQLDESIYKIRSEKEHYNYNEPVAIFLKGEDINGYNILDGRVELNVKTDNIIEFNNDRVFVPKKIWNKQVFLEPVGETKIIIPDSVLPDANIKIKVEAIFNNSNNETHQEQVNFYYTGAKKWILSSLEDDSLEVNFFDNNNLLNGTGWLIGISKSDTILHKKINFPFKEKINPFVHKYYFTSNETMDIMNISEEKELFSCDAYKVNDSVLISFINPRKLPIHYTIYKNRNTIIEEGETIDLNKIIIDKSDKSYFISCNYIWGGEGINKEYEVHTYNKNLNIEINQPHHIYPGEKVNITVKVKDYKEQPVDNVNLTVGAINSQFKDDNLPKVPYYGKYRKNRPYINSFSISKKHLESSHLLSSDWINSMELRKSPYYQFIYPFNTLCYSYEPIDDLNNAQFAPFIFSSGRQVIIKMIYIDNKLVFYDEIDKSAPYSFITEEGYHTIKLRTPRREYEIDSVLIKNNFKLNLSFDADSLSSKIKVKEKLAEINGDELDNLNQHLLFLKNNFGYKSVSLSQGNKSINFKTHYSNDNIVTTGPFYRDTIHFEVENGYQTSFMFEPDYYYTLSKDKIKIEKKEPLKPIILSYHSYRTDKSFNEVIKPKLIESGTTVWDKPLEKNYSTSTLSGNGTLQYKYEGDSTFCLVKLTKLDSVNSSRFYKPYNKYIYDLIPGNYQLLFITCNNTHLLVDSINIKPDGINYVKVGETMYQLNDSTLFIESIKLSNSYPGQKSLLPNGGGAMKGIVKDKNNEEPLPFANVVLFKDDIQIFGTMSDMDGKYSFSNLSRGDYMLMVSYVGYQPARVTGVRVNNGKITFCDLKLGQGMDIGCFEMIEYCVPLISKDQTSAGGVVYIDGIRVRGSANLPHAAYSTETISKMPGRSASSIASTVGGVVMNDQLSINDFTTQIEIKEENNDSQSAKNSIRNNFKDYAFWEPNLTTNEEGEASFQVIFPDNITKWKSFAIAMDNRKHSGIGYSETKSYKNLLSQLSTPRFLVVGDQTNLIGKVSNYNEHSTSITTSFLFNDSLISKKDSIIEYSIVESLNITAPYSDSLQIQYQIQKVDGYLDGEKRMIPIFPIGVEETIGTFNVLTKDTTINFLFKDSCITTIYAENNSLAPMLKEIEDLEKYPYYCMEQTASKMIGYLLKKNIYQKMNLYFSEDRQIKKMIDRLDNGQNDDGSWGWWPNSKSNVFMTTYILNGLKMAKENGYNVGFTSRATDYLLWNLDILENNDLLDAINILSEYKIDIPYANYQRKIKKDTLSLYQELIVLKIKQNQHIKYSLEYLLSKIKKTYLGNNYWGDDNYGLYDNSNNLTLLAYQIIEKHDSLHPLLPKIRNYFLEIKGQNKWNNTIDKAQILRTILPGLISEYKNINQSTTLKISGSVNKTIVDFPYQTTMSGEGEITIEKSGGTPMYLTTYQNKWNTNPIINDSLFSITSWFEKDGKIIDSLKSGEMVELKVHVTSKRKGSYIMLEVPIPAGCSYGNNKYNTNYIEIHREYYKNKTNIFCEQLNTGDYTFTISLQPRFSGVYTLNPAKIELMYFPLFYGRNEIKRIIIK